MATQTTVARPAPFVEKLGTNLAENVLAQQGVPIVTQGLASLGAMAQPTKQSFETDEQFKTRQDLFAAQQRAALGFEQRQQALAGLAPTVASQTAQQQEALRLAEQAAGTTGIASFQPFLTEAQQAATDAGTTLGGVQLGATAFQQGVQDFMSPYQTQVIDATLAEFDKQQAIQQTGLRDRAIAAGAFGGAKSGIM